MTARGLASSSATSRLEALQAKHNALKSHIETEQRSPAATDFYLRQLKKQKLQLKEQIEDARRAGSGSG